jgi:hypothetical protein
VFLSKIWSWLFYGFFVTAIFLGVWFMFAADEGFKFSLARLFGALLGMAMIALAQDAIVKGRIRGKRRYVEKSAHPVTFWGIMAFYHILGGLLVFFALWSLVFGRGVET